MPAPSIQREVRDQKGSSVVRAATSVASVAVRKVIGNGINMG
jgi:hypothetical protein